VDLLLALVTRGISTFAATGSNALRGRWPPAYRLHYSASGLPPGLHYGSSCSLLLRRTWGQHLPFHALPVGHGLLTSLLCSGWPACFSAGEEGAALLALTPRQRSPVPEGKKLAVRLAPARHTPQGILTEIHCGTFRLSSALSTLGLFGYTTLAILKNSSAASRAMSRSCQSNKVLLSLQAASGISLVRVLPPQPLPG